MEMDIYTYIQSAGLLSIDPRRMWRPTEVTPKARERERTGEGEGEKNERVRGEEGGRNRREESERLVEKITNRGGVARDAADVCGCGEEGRGATEGKGREG